MCQGEVLGISYSWGNLDGYKGEYIYCVEYSVI